MHICAYILEFGTDFHENQTKGRICKEVIKMTLLLAVEKAQDAAQFF